LKLGKTNDRKKNFGEWKGDNAMREVGRKPDCCLGKGRMYRTERNSKI